MTRLLGFLGLAGMAAAIGMAAPGAALAQAVAPDGKAVFDTHCKQCHEPAIDRAPARADLAVRPAADIVTALTNGIMKPMAAGLSPAEIQIGRAHV